MLRKEHVKKRNFNLFFSILKPLACQQWITNDKRCWNQMGTEEWDIFWHGRRLRWNLLSGLAVYNHQSTRSLSRISLNQNSWLSQGNTQTEKCSFTIWEEPSHGHSRYGLTYEGAISWERERNPQGSSGQDYGLTPMRSLHNSNMGHWKHLNQEFRINKLRKSYPIIYLLLKTFVKYSKTLHWYLGL